MAINQLGNGLILMVLGMGVVFLFLVVLIFSTKWISRIIRKGESKRAKAPVAEKAVQTEIVSSPDAEVAIAIAIAAALRESGK